VTNFARTIPDTMYQSAIDDNTPANTRRNRYINEILQSTSGTVLEFADRGSVGIVV
jgi:hypothetical protein